MQKTIFAMAVVLGLCLGACQTAVPRVPDSGRKVVPPQGSTSMEKTWSTPSRAEGDAVLGPLSSQRR
ncbi:MAG: hypothetical protein IKC90_09135 [Akkermansia sp.]|nr:hypothetical protein [Akkermansia sp.]